MITAFENLKQINTSSSSATGVNPRLGLFWLQGIGKLKPITPTVLWTLHSSSDCIQAIIRRCDSDPSGGDAETSLHDSLLYFIIPNMLIIRNLFQSILASFVLMLPSGAYFYDCRTCRLSLAHTFADVLNTSFLHGM